MVVDRLNRVEHRVAVVALLGLALALTVYFLFHVGVGAVLSAAVAVGWGGFSILCLYALGLFLILGSAWYVLLPDSSPAALPVFVWARMVRDSASEVLPFSHIGGIVLGARAAILQGAAEPLVFASMIVDVTAEMLAQIAYVALGVILLMVSVPHSSLAGYGGVVVMVGSALAALTVGLLLALRRYGRWMTGKLAARLFPGAVATTTAVAEVLRAIYRAPARVAMGLALHFAGWIVSAIGAWIAFRLIGARVDIAPVVALESFVYAIRSCAALIPSALGVQEAAYALIAPVLGVGAEFGLAVSLLKRARDMVVGVPILLIWQALEGRRAVGPVWRKD